MDNRKESIEKTNSSLGILKNKIREPFLMLPKVVFDYKLGGNFVCIYAYLISKPTGWVFYSGEISKSTGIGIKPVAKALKLLEIVGGLKRVTKKDSKGQYTTPDWLLFSLVPPEENTRQEYLSLIKDKEANTPALPKRLYGVEYGNSTGTPKTASPFRPPNNIDSSKNDNEGFSSPADPKGGGEGKPPAISHKEKEIDKRIQKHREDEKIEDEKHRLAETDAETINSPEFKEYLSKLNNKLEDGEITENLYHLTCAPFYFRDIILPELTNYAN